VQRRGARVEALLPGVFVEELDIVVRQADTDLHTLILPEVGDEVASWTHVTPRFTVQAAEAAGLDGMTFERRRLALMGKTDPTDVFVLGVASLV